MEDIHDADMSKLEAGFGKVQVQRRRVSLEPTQPHRHAKAEDIDANDLDLDYNLDEDTLPPSVYASMQGVFSALQYNSHFAKEKNFAATTSIECFDKTEGQGDFYKLDNAGLNKVLDTVEQDDAAYNPVTPLYTPHIAASPLASYALSRSSSDTVYVPAGSKRTKDDKILGERLLVFFVPLEATKDTSFGSQVSMDRPSVQRLFKVLGANPEFLLNLIGRPDYWAPKATWGFDANDELASCDYFCQHPRWNTQHQGAPLSVYVMRRVETKLTAYIISHKIGDSSVLALQKMLKLGLDSCEPHAKASLYHTDPFEVAVLLSSLSFEASKHHVARFRRYMWEQINKVDDHLGGLETSNRDRLTELTKSLQIISQQADSHLLNADVAIFTAQGIHDAQAKLHFHMSSPRSHRQPGEDAISYVIRSMEKQKMLFQNYKSRKDGTMSLVYNLVTQGDAANNIQLSRSMKRDSTSMSAIACLTMLFLPATFTASFVDAQIFDVSQSALWWFWVALTVPLTIVVMVAWWIYRVRSEKKN